MFADFISDELPYYFLLKKNKAGKIQVKYLIASVLWWLATIFINCMGFYFDQSVRSIFFLNSYFSLINHLDCLIILGTITGLGLGQYHQTTLQTHWYLLFWLYILNCLFTQFDLKNKAKHLQTQLLLHVTQAWASSVPRW